MNKEQQLEAMYKYIHGKKLRQIADEYNTTYNALQRIYFRQDWPAKKKEFLAKIEENKGLQEIEASCRIASLSTSVALDMAQIMRQEYEEAKKKKRL